MSQGRLFVRTALPSLYRRYGIHRPDLTRGSFCCALPSRTQHSNSSPHLSSSSFTEPRITVISRTLSPAEPYEMKLHTPFEAPPTRHEIHIDMKQSGPADSGPADANFLSKIKAAVAQGDVDAVVVYNGSPAMEEWKALEGARPWHLELSEGFTELCWYEGLKHLKTPWPLRSVYIAAFEGCTGQWEKEDEEEDEGTNGNGLGEKQKDARRPERVLKTQPSFPACYSAIETLVLHFPIYQEMYFYPEGGAQNLRSLNICESEAAKTFACTVICNPRLLETLQTVTVLRLDGYESYDFEGRVMKRFFRESKALRNLELVLSSDSVPRNDDDDINEGEDPYARYKATCPYTGLHSCLPPTLEFLSLSCPADRLTLVDIDRWLSCAQNPTWLPNLRTVAFSFSLPPEMRLALSLEDEKMLNEKVEQLLEVLRERGVEVVEPRSKDEMDYPLP